MFVYANARDISVGILSQLGTFIIHRLISDVDRKIVDNGVTVANKNILSFLPMLGSGKALLVGVDFPMPLLLKVAMPKNKPDSHTLKLTRNNNTAKNNA